MKPERIRFIGGPYDGHQQNAPADLPREIALPVSRGIFRMMTTGRRVPAIVTSIAHYQLDGDAYRFRMAFAPPASVPNHLPLAGD